MCMWKRTANVVIQCLGMLTQEPILKMTIIELIISSILIDWLIDWRWFLNDDQAYHECMNWWSSLSLVRELAIKLIISAWIGDHFVVSIINHRITIGFIIIISAWIDDQAYHQCMNWWSWRSMHEWWSSLSSMHESAIKLIINAWIDNRSIETTMLTDADKAEA